MGLTPSAPIRRKPSTLALFSAFAVVYIVWGSTFLAIRFAVQTLPPLLMMGTRNLVAGLLLLLWLFVRGERPNRRLWLPSWIAGGFCFLGCHGLLAWAELYVGSGLAALLAASLPIWMVLLARLRGQVSEPTKKVAWGIGLGLVGVAILVPFGFTGHRLESLGAIAILISEVLWAVGAIYSRGVRIRTSVAMFAAMQMICGGALLWLVGLGVGEASQLDAAAFTARSVLSLAFLIVFGSLLAFTVYTWLLQVSSPALVSTHSYVNPLVAVLLGWAVAGEGVTLRTLLGAALILFSVALVSIRRKRQSLPEESSPETVSATR